jgi:hypothetical protein
MFFFDLQNTKKTCDCLFKLKKEEIFLNPEKKNILS